jgi:hypothetical protein
MRRLARRASLLVALYLLAAATAYAGCAWLVWFKGHPPSQDPRNVQTRVPRLGQSLDLGPRVQPRLVERAAAASKCLARTRAGYDRRAPG